MNKELLTKNWFKISLLLFAAVFLLEFYFSSQIGRYTVLNPSSDDLTFRVLDTTNGDIWVYYLNKDLGRYDKLNLSDLPKGTKIE